MKSSSPPLSKFSMVLLVFVSSSLLLHINNRSSHRESETVEAALEPINFIASRVSAIVMAYLSFMVYQIDPSLQNLHRRLQKSWKQTTITMMYIELLNTASASLLLLLASLGRSAKGAASEVAVIAGAVFLISWLAPLLFVHSDAACKISLIVSVAEGCKGEKALERASELVKERKVVGFSLMVLTVIIDHAVSKIFRFWSAIRLLQLLPMFFTYLMYASFYYDSKKRLS